MTVHRLTWGMTLFLAVCPAHAQEGDKASPASGPASGPASAPTSPRGSGAATPGTAAAGADKARLERLERLVREQQRAIEHLTEASEDLTDQLSELSRPHKVFSVYGFFDLNFQKIWIPGDVVAKDIIGERMNFVFGNLNTYFDFQPTSSWRVLTELRFSLNPLGDVVSFENAAAGQAFERVDVSTDDVVHYGSAFDYGSVAIERAQIEWSRFEWLGVTAGLFLTPIGIWNIDHGSPARIRVSSPFVYLYRPNWGAFFPKRQLGLMVHGSVVPRGLRLDYALTLTNGGGPVATLNDSDVDKAVGGRLALSGGMTRRWKLGLSGYSGMWSDDKLVVVSSPRADVRKEYTVRYRESVLGLDVALDSDPLLINAELLVNWRTYHDDYRPPSSAVGGAPGGLAADFIAMGGYINLAYRLPLSFAQLLAFAEAGYVDRNDNVEHDNVCELALGLNWRIRGNVVLKLEYVWFHWPGLEGQRSVFRATGDMHALQSQLAVAF